MRTPRYWRSMNALSCALLPFAMLYRLGAWADRRCTKAQHAGAPVISLGNVTAGGAGKTPATLALVPLLRTLGLTPHILTRGYKGMTANVHAVLAQDDWQQVGDEALLLQRTAPTWIASERIASSRVAVVAGANVLLCDDALQHHALHKDISLLVIDGPYGLGNGQLLPAGPLREPFSSAVKRADAVILIGEDAQQLAARIPIPVFRAHITPTGDTGFLTGKRWLAFAGIGRPQKFYDSLHALGTEIVATQDFADHHPYSTRDIEALIVRANSLNAELITTEKDRVKIPASQADSIHALPVQLVFEDQNSLLNWLKDRLTLPRNT